MGGFDARGSSYRSLHDAETTAVGRARRGSVFEESVPRATESTCERSSSSKPGSDAGADRQPGRELTLVRGIYESVALVAAQRCGNRESMGGRVLLGSNKGSFLSAF